MLCVWLSKDYGKIAWFYFSTEYNFPTPKGQRSTQFIRNVETSYMHRYSHYYRLCRSLLLLLRVPSDCACSEKKETLLRSLFLRELETTCMESPDIRYIGHEYWFKISKSYASIFLYLWIFNLLPREIKQEN